MKIAVIGLGHVGVVSAACLARDGHEIVGVDTDAEKVLLLNNGAAVCGDASVDEALSIVVAARRLRATTDCASAVQHCDASLICVSAPSRGDGSLDTGRIVRVCEDIGGALRPDEDPHLVVVRSNMPPGAMRSLIIPTLEYWSDRSACDGLEVVYNPAFFREKRDINAYDSPPRILIGATEASAAAKVAMLYDKIDAPVITTSIEAAEMVKYADNAWLAAKSAFAAEISAIAKAETIDSADLQAAFQADGPGGLGAVFSESGFCSSASSIAKDLRALVHRSCSLDVETPLLSGAILSNAQQVERALSLVVAAGGRAVSILGAGLQADVEDIRESPQIRLVEHLVGLGYDLKIYDPHAQFARLTGANRSHIEKNIPHIADVLSDNLSAVVSCADTIIVGDEQPRYCEALSQTSEQQTIIDLVRLPQPLTCKAAYHGVAW